VSAYRALCVSMLLVQLVATNVRAEEFTVSGGPLHPGKLLELDGQRGRWWPIQTALRLANEHERLPKLEAQLRDHEAALATWKERLSVCETRTKEWQHAHGLTEQRAQIAEGAIAQAEKARASAEKERREADARASRWYRSPALWFAVGAVVAAGAVGAGFAAAN
jgi:hypothetical protein